MTRHTLLPMIGAGAALLAAVAAGGAALAQTAPSAQPGGAEPSQAQHAGPASPDSSAYPPGPFGPDRMHRPLWGRRGMMGMMPPPPRGAHFHFGRGDAVVDVQCAENEPMRACADAASSLLDKLQAAPAR